MVRNFFLHQFGQVVILLSWFFYYKFVEIALNYEYFLDEPALQIQVEGFYIELNGLLSRNFPVESFRMQTLLSLLRLTFLMIAIFVSVSMSLSSKDGTSM